MAATRPGVVLGRTRQFGPNRIAFDVSDDCEEMSVSLDGGRVKALLEEMAAHPLAAVYVESEPTMGFTDRTGERILLGWNGQEVNVVRHQAPREDLDCEPTGESPEKRHIVGFVARGSEDRH